MNLIPGFMLSQVITVIINIDGIVPRNHTKSRTNQTHTHTRTCNWETPSDNDKGLVSPLMTSGFCNWRLNILLVDPDFRSVQTECLDTGAGYTKTRRLVKTPVKQLYS